MPDSPDEFVDQLQKTLARLMHLYLRGLVRFAKTQGITLPQLFVLRHIHFQEECCIGSLGTELGVSHAAASQMLEKLVQSGLVRRYENPKDRRIKRIELTEAGKQVLQESVRAHQQWLMILNEQITDEERQQLQSAFELLLEKSALMFQEK